MYALEQAFRRDSVYQDTLVAKGHCTVVALASATLMARMPAKIHSAVQREITDNIPTSRSLAEYGYYSAAALLYVQKKKRQGGGSGGQLQPQHDRATRSSAKTPSYSLPRVSSVVAPAGNKHMGHAVDDRTVAPTEHATSSSNSHGMMPKPVTPRFVHLSKWESTLPSSTRPRGGKAAELWQSLRAEELEQRAKAEKSQRALARKRARQLRKIKKRNLKDPLGLNAAPVTVAKPKAPPAERHRSSSLRRTRTRHRSVGALPASGGAVPLFSMAAQQASILQPMHGALDLTPPVPTGPAHIVKMPLPAPPKRSQQSHASAENRETDTVVSRPNALPLDLAHLRDAHARSTASTYLSRVSGQSLHNQFRARSRRPVPAAVYARAADGLDDLMDSILGGSALL